MTLWYILSAYLLLINLIAFAAMGADKHRARRKLQRIPEAALLLLAVVGGSIGGICGMLLFRHKTRHAAFFIGLPLILFAHCALCFTLFRTLAFS